MSKKNRPRHLAGKDKKARRTVEAPRVSAPSGHGRAALASPASPRPIQPAARAAAPAAILRPVRAAAQTFQTSYDYVVSDLKRIGIIAGGMFAILGILTIIIR